MSTFTAVDLSRLPAPTIIEQLDYEVLLATKLAKYKQLHPEYTAFTEADPVYKIIEFYTYEEMLVRQDFNERIMGVMLAFSWGTNLDHIGARLGVARKVLDEGDPTQGIEPTRESDTDFRRRIQLSPEGFSVAGPEGAYIFHALSAHADVMDASASSPAPGDVLIAVLSRHDDGTASPELIAHVEQALTPENVRPMDDNVMVQSVEIVRYEINATIYTFAGPDSALVIAEAHRRLQLYIADSHMIGRDVTASGIYAALHVDGVQRVVLHSPSQDITISRLQASFCTEIVITHGGMDE